MPRSATSRRPAQPPAVSLDSLFAAEEPPAAARPGGAKVIQLITTPVFRMSGYEVGDGYCPRLHGHPDIRY
ncbi:hypothetical protein ACVWYF_001605 [Hymenobacter sp. UYAg731]